MQVLPISSKTALIQVIPDAVSVHSIKRCIPPGMTLADHFFHSFPKGTEECERAQREFIRSLAAYSIVCYLLQVKDRHNANIMMDCDVCPFLSCTADECTRLLWLTRHLWAPNIRCWSMESDIEHFASSRPESESGVDHCNVQSGCNGDYDTGPTSTCAGSYHPHRFRFHAVKLSWWCQL